MPLMSFSKGAAMFDVTPIENMFLLEYLPSAPEGYLRVYLYARMLCLHPELGDSLSDIAKALNIDEDAAFTAMSYWEQQGLVERLSDNPPAYEIKPLYGGAAQTNVLDRDYYLYRDFNAELQSVFGADAKLEARHYRQANDWLNVMGMEQDAVIRVLEYELRQPGGKKPDSVYKRANRRVIDLADRGIHSAVEVERMLRFDDRVNELARNVLKRLAIRRDPSEDELECVRRWTAEWNCSDEDVIAACSETTKSRAPSIAYLDAILRKRFDAANVHFEAVKALLRELGTGGIPTPDQMKRYGAWIGDGFEPAAVLQAAVLCARRRKGSFENLEKLLNRWKELGIYTCAKAEGYLNEAARRSAEPAKPAPQKFNYQQHTYTEADFGADFYYDPAKDYGKGENK